MKTQKIDEKTLINERIESILKTTDFNLSAQYLCRLHKALFKGVLPDAGNFRTYNISKGEDILNGESVDYSDFNGIKCRLNIIFDNYKSNNDPENISKLCAGIWEIHPFNEGNTRLTAVFMEKYLRHLGYDIDNKPFEEYKLYFRNALIRANYYNHECGIERDDSYLTDFFKKIMGDNDIKLNFGNMYLWPLFEDNTETKQKTRR